MAEAFVEGLHALLVQATSPDTVALKAATATLNKEYYKKPECIPALTSILQKSPSSNIRQLSAVELRKRISQQSGELWLQVTQGDREHIKSVLPNQTLSDPMRNVRHSIARVISAIAAIELPVGHWDALLPFLSECCTSNQVANRETGSYILFTVLENSAEGFLPEHQNSLYKLFGALLNDPESLEVQVTSFRTLSTIAQYIDTDEKQEIRMFQSLIPSMFAVIGRAVEANQDDHARHLFDGVETLLILETPLLSKHIPELIQFTLQAGANRNIDNEIRIMGLNALNWTVQYKKSRIQSQGLAPQILEGVMPIGTEPEPEDIDDDTPSRTALRIIDTLATSLPPSQVFPALRTLIMQYMQSPDPTHRRCAMMALGVSIEGCSEFMTPHMSQVWPVVVAGLQDPEPMVKKAACTTIGCICEWMEEECITRHATLIPAVLSMIDHPVTQAAACTALDALLEILGSVIDQYLDPIMNKLVHMLDTAPTKTKAVVTGAIGSAAHAAKERFAPYFQPTLLKVEPFLQLTNEGEDIELRGITVDAIGTFAEAVGKEAFRPFFPQMMQQAFLGIDLGSARLRECSFLFFGVMAKVFEEEFAPYLANAVPSLLTSLQQDEHGDPVAELNGNSSDFAVAGSGATPSDAITIAEDSIEDLDVDKLLEVNSSIAVEKEIAADTFGSLFLYTKSHFLPYLEPATLALVDAMSHYYEGIRKSAVESLLEFVRTFYDLSDPQEWVAGREVKVALEPRVKELINHILPAMMGMYETEDNKSVAAAMCAGISETLLKVGPAFVEGDSLEVLGVTVEQILQQKALCQQDPDQEEDEDVVDADEQAEYDTVLISSAGDVVSALATALGADFQQALHTFLPLVTKYYAPKRSLSDRSASIGTVAEIISGMKSSITPFTESLTGLLMNALSDEEAEVYSNAAFAIGLLVENSDIDMSSQYLHILAALQPRFTVADEAPPAKFNARDNAAGAVARLIVKNTAAVPLDQVLPVLSGVLPLKNDFLENRPIFRAIFHLFRTQPTTIVPFLDQLLPVFAHVLDPNGPEQLSDELRAELIQLVGALNAENPGKIEAAGLKVYVA